MQTQRGPLAALSILVAACALGSALVVSRAGAQGTSSPAPRAVAECLGRNLVGLPLASGAAAGNLSNVVGVVNMGTTPCRLGGYPGLEGTRSGHRYPLAVSGHGTFFGDLNPTVLAPRMVGALIIGTEDGCSAINQPNHAAVNAEIAAHSYTGIVIELPRHDGFVGVNGVRFDTACVLQTSRLGWRSDLLGR